MAMMVVGGHHVATVYNNLLLLLRLAPTSTTIAIVIAVQVILGAVPNLKHHIHRLCPLVAISGTPTARTLSTMPPTTTIKSIFIPYKIAKQNTFK